ncbi:MULTISPECIES: hypothetical protein [Haloferax]|uniref:Ig-like domain-containing protein n=1 Tax=Haloferax marinum TaxID=2666143 RepID=A0A6A8G865_9EURY|nr:MULTISPECIES: hypothetical protein [Haloferax]KAB1198248.1 hypothetical protein Hfx1150_12285 [Haloferax sp. CBA1150]MRW97339.1 hypothetical protein [Haloferax marinum]
MNRRALLSLVAASVTGLAGCGSPEGETETETPTPNDGTTVEQTTTPAEERVERQLSVWNTTPSPVFTSVGVTRGGRDVYFETIDLVPGERNTNRVDLPLGETAVVVETDTGIRATTAWTVGGVRDGLEVVLGRESAEFWGRVSCDPNRECSIADGGEEPDLPLVGDGSGRWYAPAGVVVENPGSETTARLRVDLFGTTLLERTYRIPSETRLSVPITYRTGTYRVVLETDDVTVDTPWLVPDEPTKYVDTESGAVGCGPANTTLTLENRDDQPHRLSLRIESETDTFEQELDLVPGETRDLVPVVESGPKQVFARLETGVEASGMWWSCPPRGPASIVIDATGSVALRSAGPKPG